MHFTFWKLLQVYGKASLHHVDLHFECDVESTRCEFPDVLHPYPTDFAPVKRIVEFVFRP